MSIDGWVLVLGTLLVVASVHPATTAVVRWGDGRAVRQPLRPRCLADTHDLAWGDVVPLVSWARLGGRCRTCGVSIPRHLLAVEVGVPLVVGGVALVHPGPELLLLAPVAWSLVVATPIDLVHMIIPNRLTLPLAAWSLVAVTVLAATVGTWADWRRAVLVGIAVPAVMLAMSLLFELLRGEPGMGMGDVKWAPSLGLAVGWLGAGTTLVFVFTTVVTAGVVAIVLLATGRAASSRVPYGPYLAAGAAVALLLGTDVPGLGGLVPG